MSATDKLTQYKRGDAPLPETSQLWPLYGAGMENLGRDGRPLHVPTPRPGPDELLVRHDAVGLCFSDIKVIQAGEAHPRIYRSMRQEPVVLGHEVSMTAVGVGENLRDRYRVGDRFIVQADIFVNGIGYAYGYEIQGGLSQFSVIDQRVLAGDHGNYLLPVQPDTGYAESALTEPWACVIAAYQLGYRTGIKPGGTTWVIGADPGEARRYTYHAPFSPGRLMLTNVPAGTASWLKARAAGAGAEIVEEADLAHPPVEPVDDIIVLGADAEIVERAGSHLAPFGVLAIVAQRPFRRPVEVDIGRVHYDRLVTVGTRESDIAQAYQKTPVRSALRPAGRAWFVGAGGPIGRMHLQRAIQHQNGPRTIVCSDVSAARLTDLEASFRAEAEAKGLDLTCVNPLDRESFQATMAPFRESGFDDIVVLAPVAAAVAEAATYLALAGVMNVFAGLARGTKAPLDLSDAYLKDTRVIGHSASSIDDLRLMLLQTERGELSPNRSVAAVGSLSAARDGLIAVHEAAYPGKVVIYPQIADLPLTPLPQLRGRLPSVYAKLKDGREWTLAAENEMLRLMLP
jgi:D-arabinose 1-dehydrogenase-like Zn-dependent alcohol dehydrogenase